MKQYFYILPYIILNLLLNCGNCRGAIYSQDSKNFDDLQWVNEPFTNLLFHSSKPKEYDNLQKSLSDLPTLENPLSNVTFVESSSSMSNGLKSLLPQSKISSDISPIQFSLNSTSKASDSISSNIIKFIEYSTQSSISDLDSFSSPVSSSSHSSNESTYTFQRDKHDTFFTSKSGDIHFDSILMRNKYNNIEFIKSGFGDHGGKSKKDKFKTPLLSFFAALNATVYNNYIVSNDLRHQENRSSRKKRATIIWPRLSRFFADFYITIPLLAPTGLALPFTMGARYRFELPNATYYQDNFIKRSHERYNILSWIEDLLSIFGMDGRQCILRAVCEREEFHQHYDGLLNELLLMLLSFGSKVPGHGHPLYYDVREAEKLGTAVGGCRKLYKKCQISIFTDV